MEWNEETLLLVCGKFYPEALDNFDAIILQLHLI
ncbi:hypothetical protein MUK42_36066 [Musa troglodytarum]|uniref:Uncharacterized protein n=1 Tax=Musa troglodytarum TaxID=320322 RepID=A0A9E7FHX4_9LILI|nr:hypothetical protein MUK42_36066 [Musa troglodytarum]